MILITSFFLRGFIKLKVYVQQSKQQENIVSGKIQRFYMKKIFVKLCKKSRAEVKEKYLKIEMLEKI